MPKEQTVICISCPLACTITVTLDDRGDVLGVANNLCKEGKKYAIAECKFPGRILTTTILTENSSRRLLPVRTNKPVPKERLMECMKSLSKTRVRPPVKLGQIVISNIIGTGADFIATDELPV
jgi:CxxC motif-containing protein